MALGDYLTIKSSLEDMEIGDAIPCRYQASSGAVGTFSELGTANMDEIPVVGSATPNGLFYFIKVDKGLLIADRVIQHSIRWNALNAGGFIEGKLIQQQSLSLMVRSMTGGVAYANDIDKTSLSLVDKGFGAFPNNEWDKYIVNSNLGGAITPGDNNIWNINNVWSWTLNTPVTGTWTPSIGSPTDAANTSRIGRGNLNYASFPDVWFGWNNGIAPTVGFRPVLQYIEENSPQKTLWY